MTSAASTFPLDAYHQARLELWRSASIELSIGMTVGFLVICMVIVWWIFKTGYRLKN